MPIDLDSNSDGQDWLKRRQPTRSLVEASIGNGYEGYYEVRGDDNRLMYEAPGELRVELRPQPEAWQRFWRAVDKATVWAWHRSYTADHAVMDGDYWELRLQHDGRAVEASGANATPDTFEALLSAVAVLVGGRTFR